MSLEAGTYINDLVQANPPGSDDRSQADDHMRLIKSVLKNTFPNASKAFRFPTTTLEAAGTVTVVFPSDHNVVFSVNATAAVRTVSLPNPTSGGTVNEDGFSIVVFKTDSSANVVNITASGAQTINGVTTLPLQRQWDYALLWWSKANAEWYAITNTSIGTVVFGSVLSPANLTSSQNDYAPTGHESAFLFRLSFDTGLQLTGLAGGVPGRIIAITAVGNGFTIPTESASSAAANRFVSSSDMFLNTNESALFQYDGPSARWRPLTNADVVSPGFTNIILSGYVEAAEIATPAAPLANRSRLYPKDNGSGTTVWAYIDSAGVETILNNIVAGALLGIVEDNQSSGVAGGSITASGTVTRTINTEVYDRLGILSVASNQFTISAAGTYEIAWWAPAGGFVNSGFHQSFLYNATDATEIKRGSSGFIDGGADTSGLISISAGRAVVTIAGSKAFEIRHSAGAYSGGAGMTQGDPASLGTEVYTRVEIRKA